MVNFDQLAETATSPGAEMSDKNELWGQAFLLERWLFIARGTHPYVCTNAAVCDGKLMIKAFTDSDRLNRFARDNGLVEANGDVLFLSLQVQPSLLTYLTSLIEQNVYGIHFNPDLDSYGFYTSLESLPAIHDYLKIHYFKKPKPKKSKKK